MPLTNAVQAMAANANRNRVGLVVRFNEDDTTLRTVWSESPDAVADNANPPNLERRNMWRPINDSNPTGPRRLAPKSNDPTGYHAEELLMSAWDAILAGANLGGPLRTVELVLSKSPCHGPSGSSPLAFGAADPMLPQGCAGKLAAFIQSLNLVHVGVAWRIWFLTLAGSQTDSYARVGVGSPSTHMTAEDRRLANASAAQVAYRDSRARLQQIRLGQLHREASDLHRQSMDVKKRLMSADRPQFGHLGRSLGAHGKAMKKHNRSAGRIEDADRRQTATLMQDARYVSVRQAQAGIVKLEMIQNVDCRRWTGAV